jgi:hypothetical protein
MRIRVIQPKLARSKKLQKERSGRAIGAQADRQRAKQEAKLNKKQKQKVR